MHPSKWSGGLSGRNIEKGIELQNYPNSDMNESGIV